MKKSKVFVRIGNHLNAIEAGKATTKRGAIRCAKKVMDTYGENFAKVWWPEIEQNEDPSNNLFVVDNRNWQY